MLRVVIIGYGTMFTNLIAATLDANCKIVGVFRYERLKTSSEEDTALKYEEYNAKDNKVEYIDFKNVTPAGEVNIDNEIAKLKEKIAFGFEFKLYPPGVSSTGSQPILSI